MGFILRVAFLDRFCRATILHFFSVSQENQVAKTSVDRRSGPMLDLKTIAKRKISAELTLEVSCTICEVCVMYWVFPIIHFGNHCYLCEKYEYCNPN